MTKPKRSRNITVNKYNLGDILYHIDLATNNINKFTVTTITYDNLNRLARYDGVLENLLSDSQEEIIQRKISELESLLLETIK